MLFHLGALWRLNELGFLARLDRVSSVSGGSIIAGVLGLGWKQLALDSDGVAAGFDSEVVVPTRRLASTTIDFPAILRGLVLPGSIGNRVAAAYRKHVFADATLQDLPDEPRFVFNATSLQTGSAFRFTKPYLADYRVGQVRNPRIPLAVAVAASSAFPPFLSPIVLKFNNEDFAPESGYDLQRSPFTTKLVLTDGGVYDNLGLDPVWNRYATILISNGGGGLSVKPRPRRNWVLQTSRVMGIITPQAPQLRSRQAVSAFASGNREGTYWSTYSDIDDYAAPDSLPCRLATTHKLAATPTRLGKLDNTLQERLINWGYAVSDAAMRTHLCPNKPAPTSFPYPAAGVG
jgi:NTE family protein